MNNRIFRLAPRVAEEAIGTMEAASDIAGVPTRLVEQRSDTTESSASCTSNSEKNTCQKPINSSTFTLPIVLGIVLPIVGALVVFLILHRRHVKKQRLEDLNDRHASLDFGLGDVPQPGRSKKQLASYSAKEIDMKEKSSIHARQQSMDMALESPYLLPMELQSSRESLHSLSRTIHQHEDPYRPVAQAYGDGTSTRSASRLGLDNASTYTTSSHAPSRMHDLVATEPCGPLSKYPNSGAPPRQTSLPKFSSLSTPIETVEKITPIAQPTLPLEVHLSRTTSPEPMEINDMPSTVQTEGLAAPPPAVNRDSSMSSTAAIRQSNNYLGILINSRDDTVTPPVVSSSPPRGRKSPPLAINTAPANPQPVHKESIPILEREGDVFADSLHVTPPSPSREQILEGNRTSRYSVDFHAADSSNAILGAPDLDTRRLSIGLRPLPPDTVTETDDPEVRANRIRSFYKEYFDESKLPPQSHNDQKNYMGDAAYYDADHNNFVMPYAQPVTRRAMTPPPRGARFHGPPRGPKGTNMNGRLTPQMYPPGPYPQGPRAFSTTSGGNKGGPGPKKPSPPPSALSSLPTPSKLKDDSFALMGAIDFAPPQTFRDRAAGRSESPHGERRPYSPAVPAFTPTVSAFDELSAMPSPHMLRKSGTFTALDFAPPKRFKDSDTMSDAGSIRSNRSGVSAMHNQAIRNGAYRVSRIPQAVVFTRDDLAMTLKPQWDMRGPTSSVRDY